ncbi:MAG: hypothetical protein R3C59_06090 [Planctomycetaceae bacterium]
MSNAVLEPQKTSLELPLAVIQLIAGLRSKLRRYSLVSGSLLIIIVASIVFWLTSGVDAGWFALQRLELPTGLRTIFLAGMLAGGGWLLIQHVLRPLFRRIRDADLALLLERRFPEFQDRLITTVEGQQGYPETGPYVSGMLQRTVSQAANVASTVNADEVFNFDPLKKRGWVAGLLALSVVGCGVVQPQALSQWWNAFVELQDKYHVRTTNLEFTVVAQPGDRRLTFRDMESQPLYRHARGADLELQMAVPDGTSESGEAWVVPERVRVDVIRDDGTRSRTYVSSTSGNTFRFILTRLQESVSIEVLGGDFRTPVPLRIETVTPPAIDTMQVECDYPDYTGWNQERERLVPILSSEVSLPMGTEFLLQADSNKSLQSARIVTDFFELSGDRRTSVLEPREGYEATLVDAAPLLSDDGLSLTARFQLAVSVASVSAEADATDVTDATDATRLAATAETGGGNLPIPSNTAMRFFLHDEDDIISTSAEALRVRGVADKAPVVAVRTTGVSNSVTRRAIIPFVGTIQDDYRLVSAGFQFIVDDETQWRPRNFRNAFQPGLVFDLEQSGQTERFDVQPLELTEGQTLAVTVIAKDGCTIPGPNQTRAEPIVFRIVSNEELLSLLYTRELTLRRRFEEVIQQLEQVRDDLAFHRAVADRIAAAASAAEVRSEDRIALTTCATRSGNTLRRQNNALQSIAESFEEIVEQLINNAIPPQSLAETMRAQIVAPMQAVTAEADPTSGRSPGLMLLADRVISRFRVAATSGNVTSELVTESETSVASAIAELKRILENVRDMAEFHEALSDLKSILEEQQRILEETKRQQIRNLGLD